MWSNEKGPAECPTFSVGHSNPFARKRLPIPELLKSPATMTGWALFSASARTASAWRARPPPPMPNGDVRCTE